MLSVSSGRTPLFISTQLSVRLRSYDLQVTARAQGPTYTYHYPARSFSALFNMPPRGSEGLDFTPILTHYLFLFTAILAVVSVWSRCRSAWAD